MSSFAPQRVSKRGLIPKITSSPEQNTPQRLKKKRDMKPTPKQGSPTPSSQQRPLSPSKPSQTAPSQGGISPLRNHQQPHNREYLNNPPCIERVGEGAISTFRECDSSEEEDYDSCISDDDAEVIGRGRGSDDDIDDRDHAVSEDQEPPEPSKPPPAGS